MIEHRPLRPSPLGAVRIWGAQRHGAGQGMGPPIGLPSWKQPWVSGPKGRTVVRERSASRSLLLSPSPWPLAVLGPLRASGARPVPVRQTRGPRPTTGATTTTTAPLAVPSPISPIAPPALPGEGRWQPAGDRLPGGWAIYATQLRPAGGYPPSGVAWIDLAASTVTLYAGTAEPHGSWSHQGEVAPAQQPTLLAAFNAGFRLYSYDTGWFADGRAALPLQSGKASFVIFADGTATVADWGRDVQPGSSVIAVRQNLGLLVDAGAPVATVSSPGLWGAVFGGGVLTWRSGVGVTAAGDLVYVAGPDLDPASLARLLVAAGAMRAMELDINHEWVSLATFTHPGGLGSGSPTGANLIPGMYYSPTHYLAPYSRDFFAVSAR